MPIYYTYILNIYIYRYIQKPFWPFSKKDFFVQQVAWCYIYISLKEKIGPTNSAQGGRGVVFIFFSFTGMHTVAFKNNIYVMQVTW